MYRLLFLLILAIGFYAYYHNPDAPLFKNINIEDGINIIKERSNAIAKEVAPLASDWSKGFNRALEKFDWSALPSGDELLNGFEQSLTQFKKALKSNNKAQLGSLSSGMDNLILKAQTIDLAMLSVSQKQRLTILLQSAEDLSNEARRKLAKIG